MNKEFKIGSELVGEDSPVFIIGEIGINHNGSVDDAKRLIDAAKEAGCSAVKFQKRELEEIYTDEVLNNLKNFEQGFQYIIPILKDYELSQDQMAELKDYCDQSGIKFLCTPFDRVSAGFLNDIGVDAFKVASADLTNHYLITKLTEFSQPLILSTGMSSLAEIDATVELLNDKRSEYSLLHCVSSYPVDYNDANLKRISFLKQRFNCQIGYSGHDRGTVLAVAAVALGATIVEKHITLDRNLRGPDHKFSLLPSELKEMVINIRQTETAIRESRDYLLQGEMLNKMIFRKSVVAGRSILKGEKISEDMLTVKSPDSGLSPQRMSDLVGALAKRDFSKDDLFTEGDISGDITDGTGTKITWGVQGYVVRYHDFESVLQENPSSLEFHFTYSDTQLDIPHEKFQKYAEQLKDITLRIHCCEYIGGELFDICHPNLDRRLKAEGILQRVIDITSEISTYFNSNKPLIVFNCGAMTLEGEPNTHKIDEEKIYAHFANLDYKNTGLIAQNMPPYPWYFGGQWRGHYFLEAQELVRFCKKTGQKVCLDLSHAQMACLYLDTSFADYVKELKPYVRHLHISDARGMEGEGIQLGEGGIDFGEFFKIYHDYKGTWIPEIWQGHVNNHAGAKEALVKIKNFLGE